DPWTPSDSSENGTGAAARVPRAAREARAGAFAAPRPPRTRPGAILCRAPPDGKPWAPVQPGGELLLALSVATRGFSREAPGANQKRRGGSTSEPADLESRVPASAQTRAERPPLLEGSLGLLRPSR